MRLPATVLRCLHMLEDSGFACYAVGGCVRDDLLGLVPHDFDLCTSATPAQMHRVLSFLYEFGDGDTKAVQVGGASGFLVPRKKFADTAIGFQGKLTGISLPTGGSMMLFNSSRSMYNVLDNYLEFFREESCGQCTPCRVGCQQLLLGIKAVKRGEKPASYLDKLLRLTETMQVTAKCGLGQSVANSFSSIVENFREEMIY